MKGRDLILALDQGSSSTRAIAFDPHGRVAARARTPLKTRFPRPGWAEHDARDLAAGAERVLDGVLGEISPRDRVRGLGIASQRSTVVLWDARTGRPAAPVVSWQDGRAARIVESLQDHRPEIHRKTGLILTPYYSAPKVRWLLDHAAGARRLAEQGRLRIAPVSTYLLWRLTRGESYSCDPTCAQRMMLLDIGAMKWDPGLLALFGVPGDCLPAVGPSAGPLGACQRRGRRIPILAAIGDQQAAVVGLGAVSEGSAVVNYGTGAFWLHNTGPHQRRVPGFLTSVGWAVKGSPCVFLKEGTVHAAGTSFDWLRNQLGLPLKAAGIDKACRDSRGRAWLLPAIGGLGAPRWDYVTKTAVWGLDSKTQWQDLVRGVADGIGFLIADIVGALAAAGLKAAYATASGGLSRVDHLVQFQSDLTGIPIRRTAELEATALGAASLAAEAAGEAAWARRLRRPRIDKTFKPSLKRGDAARSLAAWRDFVETQAGLSRRMAALGA